MYRNNREKNKYQKVDDEDWGAPSTNHRRGEQQRRASHGEERNGGGKDATHRTRAALRRRRGWRGCVGRRAAAHPLQENGILVTAPHCNEWHKTVTKIFRENAPSRNTRHTWLVTKSNVL